MNIKVWSNFSKRRNSTKQPTGGTQISCVLKETTSIEKPTFVFNSNDFTINYVEAFGHYYFVDDIKSVRNNIIEVSCSQDVLATYKTDIGNTSAFIAYDTAANTELVDSRLALKSTPTVQGAVKALRNDISDAGSYIVSLTGEHTVGSYVVTRSALDALMPDISTVFDAAIQGSNVFEAVRDSIKQMVSSGSVPQNIRDVRWIPFTIIGDQTVPLYVGQYAAINSNGIQVSGGLIDTRLSPSSTSINIPWQFSDWRNSDSNTVVQLYIPFVGIVTYPASMLKNVSSITVDTSLDRVTGDLAIYVYAIGTSLGTYGASTGVSIPLGASGLNPVSVANNILSGAVAASIGNIPGVIQSGINMNTPMSQSVGGISSGAAAGLPKYLQLVTICHDTCVAPSSISAVVGTPSNAVKTISSLSGYVQCVNASVSCAALDADRQEINNFLNNGFYYE